MQDLQRTGSRRQFLKDGMRTVLFSGFVFIGAFLGWRKFSDTGQDSCQIDLPCRDCSILPGCNEPKATDFRRKQRHSTHDSFPTTKK